MDTMPSQSGSKASPDFDSDDEDSILGDNGDEGSKLGDEQKEIDFREDANCGDLDGDDVGDALLVAAKSFEDMFELEVAAFDKAENWVEHKVHLVASIRQLGLDTDCEKQGLKTTTKHQKRKIFPIWLKRGDIMLGELKKSRLLNLDRITIRSVAEAIPLRY